MYYFINCFKSLVQFFIEFIMKTVFNFLYYTFK